MHATMAKSVQVNDVDDDIRAAVALAECKKDAEDFLARFGKWYAIEDESQASIPAPIPNQCETLGLFEIVREASTLTNEEVSGLQTTIRAHEIEIAGLKGESHAQAARERDLQTRLTAAKREIGDLDLETRRQENEIFNLVVSNSSLRKEVNALRNLVRFYVGDPHVEINESKDK